ncbi:MAG: hypothetical protein K5765_01240, partial [Clostridia bacterium]|nr:hypothetical protein [Clostridia bacterium]
MIFKHSIKHTFKLFLIALLLLLLSIFFLNTIIVKAETNNLGITTEEELLSLIESSDNNGKTILLERNIPLSSCVEISSDISKCSDVVIDLNGHKIYRLSLNTGEDGRLFKVNKETKLTLKDSVGGSIISGGDSDKGGAIYNGGTLNIENITLSDNHATSYGGAIYNVGIVSLNNVVLRNNNATCGGAIMLTNNDYYKTKNAKYCATINNCVFSSNVATESGGALYCVGPSVDINNSDFNSNYATEKGGAIYSDCLDLYISNTSINYNSVLKKGGAIFAYDGSVCHLSNVTIKGNEAGDIAGAIYQRDFSRFELSSVTINDNFSLNEAGAIYFGTFDGFIVQGNINIINNNAPIGKNILIDGSGTISFGSSITEDSKIDVTLMYNDRKFSDGFSKAKVSTNVFSYNELKNNRIETKDNELFFSSASTQGNVYVKTWKELKDAAKKSSNSGKTIVIMANLYAQGNDRIEVKKSMTIDLNGYTVDRQRTSADEDGHVFEIRNNSTVTIKDSIGTGIITGGYAENGGGININSGSRLIFEGGTIINNKASSDGGGIFVRGELDMDGGSVIGNYAKDNGGGIHCVKEGKLNISNSYIIRNSSKNNGGGLCIYMKDNATIENTLIQYNTCQSENGGAFYMNAENKTLYLNNTKIKLNTCEKKGGGFYLDNGTVTMSNSLVFGNSSKDNGGGIFNNNSTVILNSGEINSNTSNKSGGGIQNEGVFRFYSGSIINNNASSDGGGININDGATTYVYGGKITNNKAANGGGISLSNKATLNLSGGIITNNTAEKYGGGIYFNNSARSITVDGSPEVIDNTALKGSSIYIRDGKLLEVSGVLREGASLFVEHESGYVVFTKGYSTYNTNNPSKYFIVDEWNKVTLSNNEACIEMGQASQFDDAGAFISKENQIASSDKVSGKNWMSAISGERKLNEINIPGVHDAAMNSVKGYADENVGTGVLNWTNNAKTQNEYIDELLNDGVRLFDLRINNQYRKNVQNEIKSDKFGSVGAMFSYIPADDRKNLWLVHGKTYIGGTFYAQNHDGEDLSLKEVLSWFKTFLTLHPTETIIAEFKAETSYDDQITKIYSRLYDHLEELSKEINPSTNKSFIYMEDGDFSKTLTDYPYLKDTRGQIIIKCTANNEAV